MRAALADSQQGYKGLKSYSLTELSSGRSRQELEEGWGPQAAVQSAEP